MNLSQIGLILDAIGFLLVFIFGLNPETPNQIRNFLLIQLGVKPKKYPVNKYRYLSLLGATIIIIGFSCQFVGAKD